jgi:predicted O-methyltransferase YrrM
MNRTFAIKSYLLYLLRARHKKGYGIHSPFVFNLLNAVFYEPSPYYCYENIEDQREKLLCSKDLVDVTDHGTGGYTKRRICDIARRSVKRTKYAQLLFRLANSNRSSTILELGTCLGLTTLYLSQVNRNGKVVTIDADENLCRLAMDNFKALGADNIELRCGKVDDVLPGILEKLPALDFVFFDANHTKEATLNYFELCLPKAHKTSIFVFDDIYRSNEMSLAWQQITQHPDVRLSIDVFEMGIVFFNTDLFKQDYIVVF